MKSVWEQTGEHRDFAPLKGDISTDVLIIGGRYGGHPVRLSAARRRSTLCSDGSGNGVRRYHKEYHRQNYHSAWPYL